MLTRAHRQEALSRAYIQAVAGACGLSCSFRDFDYGIDTTLHVIREVEERLEETGHSLDIQAKSTTAAAIGPTEIVYDMELDAYRLLRASTPFTPRILVLLVMPNDEKAWLDHDEERLTLRRCAYWLSLRGRPETRNRKSVRITIPCSNVFSPAELSRLMEKVVKREPL